MSPLKQLDVESGRRILIDKTGLDALRAVEKVGAVWLIESREIGSDKPEFPYASLVAAKTNALAIKLFEEWDHALNWGSARYENKLPIVLFNPVNIQNQISVLVEP